MDQIQDVFPLQGNTEQHNTCAERAKQSIINGKNENYSGDFKKFYQNIKIYFIVSYVYIRKQKE